MTFIDTYQRIIRFIHTANFVGVSVSGKEEKTLSAKVDVFSAGRKTQPIKFHVCLVS